MPGMKKTHVLACDIFKPELDALLLAMNAGDAQRYTGRQISVTYLSSLLHSDFGLLARAVRRVFREPGERGEPVLLLYGSKCHPDWDRVLDGRQPVRFTESNCVQLISGREAELGASRDFCLTSGWIAQWPGFRGDDAMLGITPEKCRAMFARHCDRALFYDTGARPPGEDEMAYFKETTGLRVDREKVGIEVFAGKFLDALRRIP